MAEGILRHLLDSRGVKNIEVSSAGTVGLDNFPASENAVEAAKNWDVDISGHRSRPLTRNLIEGADLILAMTQGHVDQIVKLSPPARDRTYLLKAFPKPYSPSQEEVRDPIGGPLEMYNQTYLELDEILRRIENDIVAMSRSSGE